MLFQVVDKFGKARGGICLPNILLTPLASIYGKIDWFVNKCILKHSSLLVSGYWVYGWSSYVGLIGSHPPAWMCLGLALCWPELILEEWELHGGHNSIHWERVPRPITTFWKNWAVKKPNPDSFALSNCCTAWTLCANLMTFTNKKLERG